MWPIHTLEYYLAIERNDHFCDTQWPTLENILLRKKSDTKGRSMIPFIWTAQSGHIMEKEGRFVVARDGDGEIGVIGKDTGFFGGDANVLKLIVVLDVPS